MISQSSIIFRTYPASAICKRYQAKRCDRNNQLDARTCGLYYLLNETQNSKGSNKMQTIIKQYKITNWCNYQQVDQIGKVIYPPVIIPAYISSAGHTVTTEQWLNDETGEGWEVRTYQVQEC